MLRILAVLLILAGTAAAVEPAAPVQGPTPTDERPQFNLLRFFGDLRSLLPIRIEARTAPKKISLRQSGDPDSVISPGAPTPSQQMAMKPAFEVNDILLKAYRPDPTVDPNDNRVRGAGAFSPLDAGGRPYQFRLGARLVW